MLGYFITIITTFGITVFWLILLFQRLFLLTLNHSFDICFLSPLLLDVFWCCLFFCWVHNILFCLVLLLWFSLKTLRFFSFVWRYLWSLLFIQSLLYLCYFLQIFLGLFIIFFNFFKQIGLIFLTQIIMLMHMMVLMLVMLQKHRLLNECVVLIHEESWVWILLKFINMVHFNSDILRVFNFLYFDVRVEMFKAMISDKERTRKSNYISW